MNGQSPCEIFRTHNSAPSASIWQAGSLRKSSRSPPKNSRKPVILTVLPPARTGWLMSYERTTGPQRAPISSSRLDLRVSYAVHLPALVRARLAARRASFASDFSLPPADVGVVDFSANASWAGTRLLGSFRTEGGREEPYCTPAPKVAVGLRLNELLRRAMAGRTRKNEPCRVPLGFHTVGESTRDLPPILDTEPLPLATITNLKFRFSHKEVQQVSGSPVALVRGTLALHVCLDGAVRAPDEPCRPSISTSQCGQC